MLELDKRENTCNYIGLNNSQGHNVELKNEESLKISFSFIIIVSTFDEINR